MPHRVLGGTRRAPQKRARIELLGRVCQALLWALRLSSESRQFTDLMASLKGVLCLLCGPRGGSYGGWTRER